MRRPSTSTFNVIASSPFKVSASFNTAACERSIATPPPGTTPSPIAAFVVLSGLYLLWYFYFVDIKEQGDPITDWAAARQADATAFLNDNWQTVGIVLTSVVVAAVGYVAFRTDTDNPATDNPATGNPVAGNPAAGNPADEIPADDASERSSVL